MSGAVTQGQCTFKGQYSVQQQWQVHKCKLHTHILWNSDCVDGIHANVYF